MQTFILSVLALLTLLESLAWVARKVNSWNESSPQDARPSSNSYAPSDSPYESISPQARVYPYPQLLPPRPADSHYRITSQYSAYPSPTPSHHSPHQSRCQPSTQSPTQTTPLIPRDVSVARPVKYTFQSPCPAVAKAPDVTVAPPANVAPLVNVAPPVTTPHEDHESFRLKARCEGDRMAECFHQSKEAFTRKQRRLAKELSLKGQAHKENMVRFDKEASAKIFQENNQRCRPNTVDLHGLYVTEAESYFERAVQQVRERGESSLRVIVGKGNHSDGNNPKIKPAIQTLGKNLGMTVNVDPMNDGCLIVTKFNF